MASFVPSESAHKHPIVKYIPQIIVPASRVDFNRNVPAKDFHHSFDNLETKTGTVDDASAPLVRSLVGRTIQELGDEISARPEN